MSSISNTPPQTPTQTRNYPLFPEHFSSRSASYYSPAFCLSVVESLFPILPTCSYILCVPLQPCSKQWGAQGAHFNWILGIYNGDYWTHWLQNLIPRCNVQQLHCPFGQCEGWCLRLDRSQENRGKGRKYRHWNLSQEFMCHYVNVRERDATYGSI